MQHLILVNEQDIATGTCGKTEVHQKGLLHRAFSIFIFNNKGDMLLQKRASGKYHSGGLWTNACCSHPTPGLDIKEAAEKRLLEEMGFTVTLTKIFDFIYKAEFENGLTEHEFDHVFTGTYEGEISPDKEEVEDYQFINLEELKRSIELQPHIYTEWFKIALPKLEEFLAKK